MDAAELQRLLASGDVDAVRRLLKHEEAAPSAEEPPGPAVSAASDHDLLSPADRLLHPSALFVGKGSVRLVMGACELRVCNHRSMGKLLWPAGHAVAEMLAGVAPAAAASSLAVLEIGAGAGVPSLVAAKVGARSTIATDFTEECVELLRHNDVLNGRKLTDCARLDVSEHSCLLELLRQHGLAEADSVLIVACDCSYDPTTVTNLFASAGQLLLRPGVASPLICFARAGMFAHLDEHTFATAHASGFALCRRTHRRAAGVLDATTETYLTPCAEDSVDCLFFVREADAHAVLPHPLLEVLPWSHPPQAETAAAPAAMATASALASDWALPMGDGCA